VFNLLLPDKKRSNFVRFGLKSAKTYQFSSAFWYFTSENGLNLKIYFVGVVLSMTVLQSGSVGVLLDSKPIVRK